ncbi:MAG: hypothetical protein Q8N95_01875 [Desulfobacterales bacterium]|nr:hypothetical protein [Desulfobacterales bacterium]
MVNKAGDSWPIVPVHTSNSIAMRKDSAVRFSSERRNELINDENKVPPETFYLWEKGKLIDIFA